MPSDIVEATASRLQRSIHSIFVEALGDIPPKRLEMFISGYTTEDFVPEQVESWCLQRLLGTTAKKRRKP